MKSLEELKALRDKMKAATDNRAVAGDDEVVVKVGMATCGIAAGARPFSARFWTKRINGNCTTSAFRRRAASGFAG